MIQILLVDDHGSTREPLAFMLEQEPDLTVVAQAGSVSEAREAISATSGSVDVAVIDLGLPDGSGEELITEIQEANPDASALVLTYFSDRGRLALAVQAGASGVLHKSAAFEEVVDAIRKLDGGGQLLSLETVLDALRLTTRGQHMDEPEFSHDRFTDRELEVLQALADGLSDKEIAERLYVGAATVRTHVTNILGKLNATSRLQALVVAIRHEIVTIA